MNKSLLCQVFFLVTLTAGVIFVPVSCTHDPFFIEYLDTICFDSQVLPILQTSCGISGCHDAASASENFIATDYESVITAVNPGDPRGSLLYNVITNINGEEMMPPDRPLTLEQRTIIHVWIEQGALHTTCEQENLGFMGSGIVKSIDTIVPFHPNGFEDRMSHLPLSVLSSD